MRLTTKMHDAVKFSEVGKFLNRLIKDEVERGGDTRIDPRGNVIQLLWIAFMSGRPKSSDKRKAKK